MPVSNQDVWEASIASSKGVNMCGDKPQRRVGFIGGVTYIDGTRNHAEEELVDVGTGSTRSKVDERYDLISPIGLTVSW
jgi:hypothetical protein